MDICDTMDLFKGSGDEVHLFKRQQICTDLVKRLWMACKEIFLQFDLYHQAGHYLKSCFKSQNLTIEELIELKETLSSYAKENFISVGFNFKDKYYTSMKRDVTSTPAKLIGNVIIVCHNLDIVTEIRLLLQPMLEDCSDFALDAA